MEVVEELKLLVPLKSGQYIRVPAKIERRQNRVFFHSSPFALKDEIKAMAGSKWHGFEEPPRKMWSVSDCPRNWFQIKYLSGEDPYAWFDRPLIRHEYIRSLFSHQKDMADAGLTYHYQIWAAEMGTGKTLAAIEVIERSGHKLCYWVGPKSTLHAIRREFKKWKLDQSINVELMTYEKLKSKMDLGLDEVPGIVIFDEAIRLKTASSQRTHAAQRLADAVRAIFGMDGYVILMGGTPAPKSPIDWWAQAEVCYPGFLKEGSPKAMAQRMGYFEQKSFDAGTFMDQVGWRDDEAKCHTCGKYKQEEHKGHKWQPSINEVALLYERLKGLVVVKHKKDCLDLPDKIYRKIKLKPSESVKRLAQAVMQSADRAVTALCQLREISDGFLYREEVVGEIKCTHCEDGQVMEWYDPSDREAVYKSIDMMRQDVINRLQTRLADCPKCHGTQRVSKIKRVAKNLPTPKEEALVDLLDEVEEQGRIVIFAGFTGSVDRVVEICLKNRWDVVRCDGRGFSVYRIEPDGDKKLVTDVQPLDYWSNMTNSRVAFVAHPESGGEGLTLTEASMEVFWSNSFKPNFRTQAEDRIHRPGMDSNRGATIVDLVHLDQDERVLQVIRENRNLELMTMGELREVLG